MKIEGLADSVAAAQITFLLLLIAVFLMVLVFGKFEREMKPRHKEKHTS